MVTLDLPAPTRTTALACRGLVKRYGTTVAVDGVDLEVPRGSLTALLGPSGCGKTTVLRMVAGLLAPDAGEIVIDGRTVADRSTSVPPEKRPVGLVFQDYALFPHLSVARNVAYGLGDLPRRERRERVHEVLDLVGLGGPRTPAAVRTLRWPAAAGGARPCARPLPRAGPARRAVLEPRRRAAFQRA